MFKKMVVAAAIVLTVPIAGAFRPVQAQEAGAAKSVPEAAKSESAYRLDFSVTELEDGKKINARQYSLNLNSNSSNELKIGTRVPVEVKEGESQYIDVGTSIWGRLEDHGGALDLAVRAEMSNFALPDQDKARRPIIRQLKISGGTLVLLGKPMVVGSVDDPNSNRQFQLEVTVTKLR